MNALERLSRAIARVNRWLAPAAVAAQVEPSGGAGGGQTPVDAEAVKAIVGEIERPSHDTSDRD